MIRANYPAINPQRELPAEALADCFRPPTDPIMVRCLHCGREYTSDLIFWDESDGADKGFWRCPIEGCGGAGFQFDIHPLDSALWDDSPEEDEEGEHEGWWAEDTGEAFEDSDPGEEEDLFGPTDLNLS